MWSHTKIKIVRTGEKRKKRLAVLDLFSDHWENSRRHRHRRPQMILWGIQASGSVLFLWCCENPLSHHGKCGRRAAAWTATHLRAPGGPAQGNPKESILWQCRHLVQCHLGERLCRRHEEASRGAKNIDFAVSQAYTEFLLRCMPATGPETTYLDPRSLHFLNLTMGIIMPAYTATLMFFFFKKFYIVHLTQQREHGSWLPIYSSSVFIVYLQSRQVLC